MFVHIAKIFPRPEQEETVMKPKALYRDLIELPYIHRFAASDGQVYEARHNEPGVWSMYIYRLSGSWEFVDKVFTDKRYPTCMDLYNLFLHSTLTFSAIRIASSICLH